MNIVQGSREYTGRFTHTHRQAGAKRTYMYSSWSMSMSRSRRSHATGWIQRSNNGKGNSVQARGGKNHENPEPLSM